MARVRRRAGVHGILVRGVLARRERLVKCWVTISLQQRFQVFSTTNTGLRPASISRAPNSMA